MSEETKFQEARSEMSKTIRWEEEQTYTMKNGEKVPTNSVYLGNVIEGEYVDKKEGLGDNKSKMYFIKLKETEEVVGVWGNAILDDRFEKGDHGQAIGLWSQVRITALGMKQSKKAGSRMYRDYRVEFAAPKPQQMKEASAATQPQY